MRLFLAGIHVAAAATVLAWPVVAFGSLFLFDAPGSASSPLTVALSIAMLTYPVGVIGGNVLFWRRRREASVRSLVWITALTLAGLALDVGLFGALEVVCGGNFACS